MPGSIDSVAPSFAIPAARDNPVQPPTGDAGNPATGHVAIPRGTDRGRGIPKLPLQPSTDPNFLRSPKGHLATSLVRPFLTPAESMRLAQTSRGILAEISGEPAFQLAQRYLQLRKNYVERREILSKGLFDGESVKPMLAVSRLTSYTARDFQRHSNVNAFLKLRTDYMARCISIATECHKQEPLPGFPMLQKIDCFLTNWDSVTSKELLAFEEELLACVDNTAKWPGTAHLLHDHIWLLIELEVADPLNRLDRVRDSVHGMIDNARERLLELTLGGWHSANDQVPPSWPPENRVRFFHHAPATDWTADKVLEQQADVNPQTGAIQATPAGGQAWTQSVAWPNPDQGEIRHRFEFYDPFSKVQAYSCVHLFNSRAQSVNMDEPD